MATATVTGPRGPTLGPTRARLRRLNLQGGGIPACAAGGAALILELSGLKFSGAGGAVAWHGDHPDRRVAWRGLRLARPPGPRLGWACEAASSLVPRVGARAGRRHYLAAAIC